MMLLAMGFVAHLVGDSTLALLSLAVAGAVLGFFVWNFPAGLIFLGDGGAYFLGFVVAEIGILLLQRNPEVSPLCPLLIVIYPVFETVFSMYRRKWLQGRVGRRAGRRALAQPGLSAADALGHRGRGRPLGHAPQLDDRALPVDPVRSGGGAERAVLGRHRGARRASSCCSARPTCCCTGASCGSRHRGCW